MTRNEVEREKECCQVENVDVADNVTVTGSCRLLSFQPFFVWIPPVRVPHRRY